MSSFNTADYTLKELESIYDRYYRYSDDHSVFMKHSMIEKTIKLRKEALKEQNIEEE